MKRALLIILLVLFIAFAFGLIYINKVFLPLKIKSTLTDSIEKASGFSVRLEKIRFSIFKGLVLEEFSLSDGQAPVLKAAEVQCSFLLAPLIRRQVVVPSLKIISPSLFLQRRQDKSFNIGKLLNRPQQEGAKGLFSFLVYNIYISNGSLDFRDDSLDIPFQAKVRNLDFRVSFPLPSLAKFKLKAEVVDAAKVEAGGDFNLLRGEFKAQVIAKDVLPGYFYPYYGDSGIAVKQGKLDIIADLRYRDEKADIYLKAESSDDISVGLNDIILKARAELDCRLQFDTGAKSLAYAGSANIIDGELSGIKETGEIKSVNAAIKFDNSGLSADKILAQALGFPVEAKLTLRDYKNPAINIEARVNLQLDAASGLLKERFAISLPCQLTGEGRLFLNINKPADPGSPLIYSGILDIINGQLDWDKFKVRLRDISGRINFDQNQLTWQDLNFYFGDLPCKTGGMLKDYAAPSVNLTLSSRDLALKTSFSIKDKLLNLAEFNAEYLKSEVWIKGSINIADAPASIAHLNLDSRIDLAAMEKLLGGLKLDFAAMKPQGTLSLKANLNGELNNPTACDIEVVIEGPLFSLYGFKGSNLIVNYLQRGGLGELQGLSFDFYGGIVSSQAKINLSSANFPYRIEAAVDNVSLEELKSDTTLKDKPLAGMVKASANFSGFWRDISKLGGNGRLFITDGNLWQLDLFKGLGSFVFARDFANIVFSDGSCSFIVSDRHVYSEDIKLKSSIVNLVGTADIGFDSSLNAALDVEVLDENVPLTGTFKDVATAIIGSAGRFGVIKVSGTLSKPQYTFKTAVVDIIQSLKNAVLKNISR